MDNKRGEEMGQKGSSQESTLIRTYIIYNLRHGEVHTGETKKEKEREQKRNKS